MASLHKVIKLLKFKSAAIQWKAQSRVSDRMRSQQNALSRLRLPWETMQIFAADLNFKSFITL